MDRVDVGYKNRLDNICGIESLESMLIIQANWWSWYQSKYIPALDSLALHMSLDSYLIGSTAVFRANYQVMTCVTSRGRFRQPNHVQGGQWINQPRKSPTLAMQGEQKWVDRKGTPALIFKWALFTHEKNRLRMTRIRSLARRTSRTLPNC